MFINPRGCKLKPKKIHMRYIIFGLLLVILLVGAYIAYTFITTKNHSPAHTMVYQDGSFLLTVDYSRPFKKDRLIFGEGSENPLLPYGEYWRTGANEATEIDFNRNILIEGNPLKSGRYRLYTFPGKDNWEIVFNTELDKWGYSEPDHSMDILRISVPVQKADSVCEQFLIMTETIQSSQLNVNLCWDKTIVPFLIEY
jgi:hypothetical protein